METQGNTAATPYMDFTEAAAFLRLGESTLRKLAMRREVPFCKVGTRCVFDRRELDTWMQARRVTTSAENATRAAQFAIGSKRA